MNGILRNILATIFGLLVGGLLNGKIVDLSTTIIPLPDGVVMDPNNIEQLKAVIPTLPLPNFIMPFLAHALGTLVAAFLACKWAVSHKLKLTIIVASLFFIGGVMINFMIGGPIWFIIVDLLFAYFPMAFLGKKIAGEKSWMPNL